MNKERIAQNMAVVEIHFHSEALSEVEAALERLEDLSDVPNRNVAARASMIRVNSSATVKSPVVTGQMSLRLFVRRFVLETIDRKTTT